jgi:hypothetical protein
MISKVLLIFNLFDKQNQDLLYTRIILFYIDVCICTVSFKYFSVYCDVLWNKLVCMYHLFSMRETRRDYMLKFYIIVYLCNESMQMCCVLVRLCYRIYSYVKLQYTKWDNINRSQWIKILTVRFILISHFNYNRLYYTVVKPRCVVYWICNKETAFMNHWKFVVNFHLDQLKIAGQCCCM